MDLQCSYFPKAATKTVGLVCLFVRWLLSEPPMELNTGVGYCNVTKVAETKEDLTSKQRLEVMLGKLKKEESVGTYILF